MTDNMLPARMEAYVRNMVDDEATVEDWGSGLRLPFAYMAAYRFFRMTLLARTCLLAVPRRDAARPTVLGEQATHMRRAAGCPVVFLFPHLTTYRRKRLVADQVAFLVGTEQMFLPFLMLDFQNKKRPAAIARNAFSPAAQQVFLLYLYNRALEADLTFAAKKLGVAPITASRALNELTDQGFLLCRTTGKTGRRKLYRRRSDTAYFDQGRDRLTSPVLKTVYLPNVNPFLVYPCSGQEALSLLTRLHPPAHPIRAVSRTEFKNLEPFALTDPEEIADSPVIEVQVWRHEPSLFGSRSSVDVVSAVLSTEGWTEEKERLVREQVGLTV